MAKSTGEPCRKRALPRSSYCLFHIEKTPLLIGAVSGALISLILNESYRHYIPSQELKEMRIQFEEVKSRLDPFVKLAQSMYPDVATDDALQRLKAELDGVREMASRDMPREPTIDVLQSVFTHLRDWQVKYPEIEVVINLGNGSNKNARLMYEAFLGILDIAGVKSKRGLIAHNTIIMGDFNPILFKSRPGLENASEAFLDCISSYIQGSSSFSYDVEVPPNTLDVTFNGTPKFSNNGSISLE